MILAVNAHQAPPHILELAAGADAAAVRCDLNTYDVWPARDQFDWDWFDEFLETATRFGMLVYPTISYAPKWLSPNRNARIPVEDWKRLIRAFGERYNGRIQFVGIWNEPNIRGMYSGTVMNYIFDLLVPAAETLKELNPSYQICGPDLSTTGSWRQWLAMLLTQGRPWLDVLTVHAYGGDGRDVRDKLLDAREVMRIARRLELPVSCTEFGWNSARISEEAQANHCDQFLESVQGLDWLRSAFWFNLINESTQTQWGLFRSDRSEKPVAVVFRRYAARV